MFLLKPRNLLPEKYQQSNIRYIFGMGKRGNIVQAYPAMEYRFFPERVSVTTDDLVCFVWSGKNYSQLAGLIGHFRFPKSLKMSPSFICMRMKNHFHIKGWALKLVLIQRPGGTRKCPIKQVPHVAATVFVNKRALRDETCVTTLGCIHTIPVPTGKVWKALETARDCSKSFTHIEHRAGAVGREGLVN